MLLIAGATGNVGGELVHALRRAGEPVRALTHTDQDSALPPDVERAAGDLNDPAGLTTALNGVRGVFLLSGYADMPGLLTKIRDAGARHIVLLSSGAVDGGDPANVVVRYHAVAEAAVKDAGLPWTILRPSGFHSNALRWLPQLRAGNVVREPFANVPVAGIDPFDIAAVAAVALTTPGHDHAVYRLTGPEAILPADRLRVLAHLLGRDLHLHPLTDDEARVELGATMPSEYVDAFFNFFVDGSYDDAVVLPTISELLGRPARTFRQWAEAHADAFR
ncbi:SDR family oxidoreductase [Micromonospora sp. NPDC048930]|uniref:SDR family oxidoreductase n=1 Tax=Micromonospora sp. NPDC048930 TaxID=3364261 RepID=UPI00371FC20F